MCEKSTIKVIVDNHGQDGFVIEHGLALYIETPHSELLFDTGAGEALLPNMEKLSIKFDDIEGVIISHGHRDHTGALPLLSRKKLWSAPNMSVPRCSRHPDRDIHHIGSPLTQEELAKQFALSEVTGFAEIGSGLFLTGPIPRISMEDSGGPFFFDSLGELPDSIADEQAMLTSSGVLISGCCHAGIINTMEWCKKAKPEIEIHTIIGGLHLGKASPQRLEMTANYLLKYGVKKLYLMHCTGESAIDYLQKNLSNCDIVTAMAGDVIDLG